eukprot:scaffold1169_cov367-Prasinococcus_capsulatus_cf.AAC.13
MSRAVRDRPEYRSRGWPREKPQLSTRSSPGRKTSQSTSAPKINPARTKLGERVERDRLMQLRSPDWRQHQGM